jgi:hypothetical protein
MDCIGGRLTSRSRAHSVSPPTRLRQIERDALKKLRAHLEGSFAGEADGPVVCSARVRISN